MSIVCARDECHPLAQIRQVLGASLRPLLMTGSLSLTYSNIVPCRLHQPGRRQPCCSRARENLAHAGIYDLTSTGSSGSSSDGSETGLRKPPGSLRKKDFRKFVHFFRQASPYIEGHREKTFVIVIPGEVGHRCLASLHTALYRSTDPGCDYETRNFQAVLQVVAEENLLSTVVEDIALLHSKHMRQGHLHVGRRSVLSKQESMRPTHDTEGGMTFLPA